MPSPRKEEAAGSISLQLYQLGHPEYYFMLLMQRELTGLWCPKHIHLIFEKNPLVAGEHSFRRSTQKLEDTLVTNKNVATLLMLSLYTIHRKTRRSFSNNIKLMFNAS